MFNIDDIEYLQAGFEIRFQSNLFILERRSAEQLSKKVKDVFPMRGQYSEKLLSYTNNHQTQAHVGLNNIILQMEEPVNLQLFSGYINKFAPDAAKIFEMSNIARIGFRLSTLWAKDSLEEANQCYFQLMKIDKSNIDEIGSVVGFSSSVLLKSDIFATNIVINPAIQQKMLMNFKDGSTNDVKYGIMVTSDFFIEGGVIDIKISDFTKHAVDNFNTNVIKFLNSVV